MSKTTTAAPVNVAQWADADRIAAMLNMVDMNSLPSHERNRRVYVITKGKYSGLPCTVESEGPSTSRVRMRGNPSTTERVPTDALATVWDSMQSQMSQRTLSAAEQEAMLDASRARAHEIAVHHARERYVSDVQEVAERLRRLAEEIDRYAARAREEGVSADPDMPLAALHEVGRAAEDVTHAVTWGVANLNLSTLLADARRLRDTLGGTRAPR